MDTSTPTHSHTFATTSRIATIDVGTNTALLLVAEGRGGRLVSLHEADLFVRLGEGVDASRRIGAPAMARLRTALLAHRKTAKAWGAELVGVAGTSASRDAANQDELIAFVRRETGLDYEILSGDDEARWTFAGAVSGFDDLDGTCAVLDIGGGSTEVVVGLPGGAAPAYRCSLDVGSVRLTERYLRPPPPSAEAVARAAALVSERLAAAAPPLGPQVPFIAAAGTAMALALVAAGATDRSALQPADHVLAAATVHAWRRRLLALTPDEVLAINPAVMTGRADVFAAGVLLLDMFLQRYGVPACRVSTRSLRHGLALRALAAR